MERTKEGEEQQMFNLAAMLIETRIHRDPQILGGKPIIRGTRIPVYVIIDCMFNAIGEHEILEDYPSLSLEDVRAALAFHLRHEPEASMNHLYELLGQPSPSPEEQT